MKRCVDNVLITTEGNLLLDSSKKIMLHSGVMTLQSALELKDLPTRVTTYTPLPKSFLAHYFANGYDESRILYSHGPKFSKENIEEDIRHCIENAKNRQRNRKILQMSTRELLEDGTIVAENVGKINDTKKLVAVLEREETSTTISSRENVTV